MKKRVVVLGSTGSIGRSTIEVIEHLGDDFEVVGLACRENVELFNAQIRKFRPRLACIFDGSLLGRVEAGSAKLLTGPEGLRELVGLDAQIVVNALPGSIGLEPSVEALRHGKVLALANKESLVMAGRLLRQLLAEHGGRLIPVDSEHSALYQLLRHTDRADIEALIITASGGPFREYTREGLKAVKPEEALEHPTWKMGRKVTLDSATLMNKGLEVIEARWLFDIEPSRIRVLVHPESIVHGMVELVDGTILVNMAYPDMKVPISYALNEEKRRPLPVRKVDLAALTRLTFFSPDIERFPSLGLAYEALKTGDSAQIVLNAANEVAVTAFMEKKIRFTGIPRLIEETLVAHTPVPVMEDFAAIKGLHEWATDHALTSLGRFND